MELAVYNIAGKDTGKKITLSDEIFGIVPNEHVVYLDVKQYLANQRQGTHKAKERAEVSRSTRKIKKQKGTGGARAGSMKSPLMKGGGRIFGPRPRDYHFKLNKKVKSLARQSALAAKAQSGDIAILDTVAFDAPKTKLLAEKVKAMGLESVLIIADKVDENLYLASRNLHKVGVVEVQHADPLSLIHFQKVLILKSAVAQIEEMLK